MIVLVVSFIACAAKKQSAVVPTAAPVNHAGWNKAAIPFVAANLTAVGSVLWACGSDESIASSADGGNTWKVMHQNRGSGTLLNIAFVNDKVGNAAGTRLLSTTDGGATWTAHETGGKVWAFSFADAKSGIAVIGGRRSLPTGAWGEATLMTGPVKLTQDAGDHWEDIPALATDALRSFNLVLAVAALDAGHYLMIREQPEVEDVYVLSGDAGQSWKVARPLNDGTNRELPRWIFVNGGEYWAFGMELLHREKGGGYGAPMALRSKDGETWVHGVGGPNQYGGCNWQGCYLWDGVIEKLYGKSGQYWDLPQDGSMSIFKWAIAGDRACTVGRYLECGPVAEVLKPQPRPDTSATYRFDPAQKWEQ